LLVVYVDFYCYIFLNLSECTAVSQVINHLKLTYPLQFFRWHSFRKKQLNKWNVMSIRLHQIVKHHVNQTLSIRESSGHFNSQPPTLYSKFGFQKSFSKLNFQTSILTSFYGSANSSLGKVYVFCCCCWWCSFCEWFTIHILSNVTMFALWFLCLLQEICRGWFEMCFLCHLVFTPEIHSREFLTSCSETH